MVERDAQSDKYVDARGICRPACAGCGERRQRDANLQALHDELFTGRFCHQLDVDLANG
jgi:hypothetical protein